MMLEGELEVCAFLEFLTEYFLTGFKGNGEKSYIEEEGTCSSIQRLGSVETSV